MGSVLLQWEREGRKQGEKEARKDIFESFLSFFFFFFSVSACTCFQLHLPVPNPSFKNSPCHPIAGETGALLEALPTAVPAPLQMFASCCSGAMQRRQLIEPCPAGLQCSAEGAGDATVTNDLLIM